MANYRTKKDSRNRKRVQYIKVYLSESELKYIGEEAQKTKDKSKSAWCRNRLLTPMEITITDINDIKLKQYKIMSGIGNNINQIARIINYNKLPYMDDINEIKKVIEKIWQLLRF